MSSSSLVLSTDTIAVNDSADAWNEWMRNLFFGLQSDLYGDRVFDGHLHTIHAGEIVMTKLEANRHRVIRSSRAARSSDAPYLKILAPWSGHAAVEQQGRQASACPGGWVIYDTSDNYGVANPERSDHLIVMIPKEHLVERGLRLDELMCRQMGAAKGISRVALETMRSTFLELPSMTAEAIRGAGDLVLELVRLSLQELAGRSSSVTQLEAFKDRIRDYIARHLRDPGLSIDRIAQSLNCSKRHLHNAFADEDVTLTHYILERRLQACMRDLKKLGPVHRTITDIAFSWGFTNCAYFSRVFRDRTGLSPSEFRIAMAVDADDCQVS